jgi:hypothetical protein
MADSFADLAQKSTELIDEFSVNSETQRQIVRHGETLLGKISISKKLMFNLKNNKVLFL